jgi:hypothetical protein
MRTSSDSSSQPETDVRFIGESGYESASGSDGTNLPDQVESGVT